jgi:flagellar L-ring protein precursor FlgH
MTSESVSRKTILAAVAVALLMVTGCGHKLLKTTPTLASDLDRLHGELDVLPPFPEPAPSSGSIWTDGGPGAALVRDNRAFRVNDLVTIRVVETAAGTNASTTELARSSEAEYGAPIAFGFEDPTRTTGQFNLAKVLSTGSESEFSGDGKTTRSSKLAGTITARVMRVLANGDLVVAGQKTVMVNRDRQILTLVGSVRPVDVDTNNQVSSAAVGDLTVRLWGRGEVDDTVRQGWFMRIMQRIWPF